MITEVVHFSLPSGTSRAGALAKYRQTAAAWAKNPDLVHKFYFFDEAKCLGGGVYIWKTMAAAVRWHGDDYKARIRALYDSEPSMTYYDTLLVVDNIGHQTYEPSEA